MNSSEHNNFLLSCPTYESYLDSFLKRSDKYYLRNDFVGRTLVTLGYRSTSTVYTERQFERLKAQIWEQLTPQKRTNILFSYGTTTTDPVIKSLAQRELPNMQKAISTIFFIKFRNPSGYEISGFVDYEHSLRHANLGEQGYRKWSKIFTERSKLRPRRNDLSYYDWHRNLSICNNSDNYVVDHDRDHGLLFIHRGDHKRICADNTNPLFKQNCTYTTVRSKKYGEVIFFDHVIRKKI